MEEKITTPNSEIEGLFDDLEKLVQEELGSFSGNSTLRNVFRPLTTGLGLHPPQKLKKDFEAPLHSATPPKKVAPPESPKKAPSAVSQVLGAVQNAPQTPPPLPMQAEVSVKNLPPALPQATVFRRILAGFLDIFFVFTLWGLALATTLKFLTGSFLGVAENHITMLQNPQFLRFAVLEFFALWLSYLALGIGTMDMTFGMWIWGLRVSYGKNTSTLSKKFRRVVFSFLFYALGIPLLLLLWVGRKGRNLLDILSGTQLYRCPT